MPSDAQQIALLVGEVRGDVKALLESQARLEASLSAQQVSLDAEISEIEDRLTKQEGRWIYLAAATIGVGLASPAAASQLLTLIQSILS